MKKIILQGVNNVNNIQDLNDSTFPVFIRFYDQKRNLLSYKQDAVPFFLKTFTGVDNEHIEQIKENESNNKRLSKGYLFSNFSIYKINDYGHQAMSAFFEDFLPLCFDNEGYKIPQKDIVIMKNYTSKEAFILIPNSITDTSIKMIIEFRGTYSYNYKSISRGDDGNFTFNLQTQNINSLDDVKITDTTSSNIEIKNSEYFMDFHREEPLDGNIEFISEQAEYFRNPGKKNIMPVTVKLIENLRNNNLNIRSNQYGVDYYYMVYTILKNVVLEHDISDVYKKTDDGFILLVPGRDYYINLATKKINIVESSDSDIYEVFLRKTRKQRIVLPFTVTTDINDLDIGVELYHNHIVNWNIDTTKSIVTVFENGLLKGSSSELTTFSTEKEYIYIIDDIVLTENKEIPVNSVANANIEYIIPPVAFDKFNKYTIVSDPYLNTFGETMTKDYSTQELFLYDENLKFKITDKEPSILETKEKYKVKGLDDPYTGFSIGDAIGDYHTDLEDLYNNNNSIQNIENSLLSVKKNFYAIVENSSIIDYTYFVVNSDGDIILTNTGDFLFLLIKEKTGTFDITYYNSNNEIIRKEYSCQTTTIDDLEGRFYMSVPDTEEFSKIKITTTYDTESIKSQGSYYIFK